MGFKFAVITYRLLFALLIIATVAWQLSDRAFGPGFSFVNFFSFFTILSNLLLAAVFISTPWIGRRSRLTAGFRGAAVLYMTITGIVYAVLLAPLEASGGLTLPWVNTVLHQIMPVVAIIDWLLVPPRVKLGKRIVLAWLIFPLVYLIYTLIRGHFIDWYPYPFLDPFSQGYGDVIRNVMEVALAFLVLGALIAWVGNRIRQYAKLHPHHYPHFVDSNTPAVDWTGMRRSWMVILLLAILAVILAIGGWAGWRMWQSYQIETSQHLTSTDNPNVKKQIEVYSGQFIEAQSSYALTNNQIIDNNIRSVVNDNFEPCRRAAVKKRHEPVYICRADFKILYETKDYLAIMYTFIKETYTSQLSLMYSLKTGEQLPISSLFTADSKYHEALSGAARQSLAQQFKDQYQKNPQLKTTMEQNTSADSNFNNFYLSQDEKLFIYYQPGHVAENDSGVVRAEIDPNKVFGILKPEIIDSFFPKLKKQKEEERKLADAARQAAKEAEVARQHTRSLVAPNRSNINCAQMKCLALTFDDGPGAYTNQVLDTLSTRRAAATFFVLGGSASRNGAILQRIVNDKSEVANHSWSHANLTNLSNQKIADEVELTNHAIHAAIGVYPKLMRPPYGAYDGRVIAAIGMPIALWSVDTNDWKRPGSSAVCQRAVGSASPGAVILMHDIHAATVAAVPCIVDELQRQGYVLVTMSELFGIDSSNVQSYSGQVLRRR